jgi:aryl-alcohol dehydrogenase-like predicted oxidoreductase
MLWSLAVVDTRLVDQTLAWMDERTWEYHFANKLTAIPYSSQANGLFQKMEKALGDLTELSLSPIYPLKINKMRYDRIKQVSLNTGYTITQIVIGYLLSQPINTIPIIGPKNKIQLEDSISGTECRLTENQIHFILGEEKWTN